MYLASRGQLSYTPSIEHVVGWKIGETQPVRSENFRHFPITSCSREKRYQVLPIFPYWKQRKAGRGLGTRLHNAVPLVWGSFRPAPIISYNYWPLHGTCVSINPSFLSESAQTQQGRTQIIWGENELKHELLATWSWLSTYPHMACCMGGAKYSKLWLASFPGCYFVYRRNPFLDTNPEFSIGLFNNVSLNFLGHRTEQSTTTRCGRDHYWWAELVGKSKTY